MRKIIILIAILIISTFLLNANEIKHNDDQMNIESHFSFNVSQNAGYNDLQNYSQADNNLSSISKAVYADNEAEPVKEVSIDQKIKNSTACGITGTVFFVLSWFFIIPGAVLMGDGYDNKNNYKSSTNYNGKMSEYYGTTVYNYSYSYDWTEFYVGVGLFVPGILFFLIGTPLMIAGWALRAYYKNQENKVSIYMDSEKDKTNFIVVVSL